jgi:hypothetical protein
LLFDELKQPDHEFGLSLRLGRNSEPSPPYGMTSQARQYAHRIRAWAMNRQFFWRTRYRFQQVTFRLAQFRSQSTTTRTQLSDRLIILRSFLKEMATTAISTAIVATILQLMGDRILPAKRRVLPMNPATYDLYL